jgi:hypothetical protein
MKTHERPGRSGLASSLGAGLGAVLLPKCPLCVAAVLSSLGLGATAAGLLAVVLRPAALTLAGAGLIVVAWAAWRARRGCQRSRSTRTTVVTTCAGIIAENAKTK